MSVPVWPGDVGMSQIHVYICMMKVSSKASTSTDKYRIFICWNFVVVVGVPGSRLFMFGWGKRDADVDLQLDMTIFMDCNYVLIITFYYHL